MRDHDVLTTGEAAAICGVSHHTIQAWIRDGLLPAWRVPGSRHRRIARADLERSGLSTGRTPRTVTLDREPFHP